MENYLFIGLGNPGPKYANTRHNLGIATLKLWVASVDSASQWQVVDQDQAELAQVVIGDTSVTGIFPLAEMNNSGQVVAAYLKKHPYSLERLLIIHDDLEVVLGQASRKESGSARGHNGVKSIHDALATQDIRRLRLGIGRPPEGVATRDYVLSAFSEEELLVLQGAEHTSFLLLASTLASPEEKD